MEYALRQRPLAHSDELLRLDAEMFAELLLDAGQRLTANVGGVDLYERAVGVGLVHGLARDELIEGCRAVRGAIGYHPLALFSRQCPVGNLSVYLLSRASDLDMLKHALKRRRG